MGSDGRTCLNESRLTQVSESLCVGRVTWDNCSATLVPHPQGDHRHRVASRRAEGSDVCPSAPNRRATLTEPKRRDKRNHARRPHCHNRSPRERCAQTRVRPAMIGIMTNHTKPTLLISNVLPARPGDEAYNNICMRLWDRLLQAALPTWNVIREYAQEDGAEGAPLRARSADAIIIMGGEDVHPAHYGASQGYNREGHHGIVLTSASSPSSTMRLRPALHYWVSAAACNSSTPHSAAPSSRT